MYKNLKKSNILVFTFVIFMMFFTFVNNISATPVSDGGGIGKMTCIYYPIKDSKDIVYTLHYLNNQFSTTFKGPVERELKDEYELGKDEIKQVGHTSSSGTSGTTLYSFKDDYRYSRVGTENISAKNLQNGDKISCPTIYAIKEDGQEKTGITVYNKASMGVRSKAGEFVRMVIKYNFSSIASNSKDQIAMTPADGSTTEKKVPVTSLPKICAFYVDNWNLSGLNKKVGEVTILFNDKEPGFSNTNVIGKANNGYKLYIDSAINANDIFVPSGDGYQCNTELFGVCYNGSENCYIAKSKDYVSPVSNKKLEEVANVRLNQAQSSDSSALIGYNGGLKLNLNSSFAVCSDLQPILDFANDMYGLIIVFIVIGLVVLTMMDFMKATASEKADANQKAFKSFKTRMIVAVIIILLPILLNFVFEIYKVAGDTGYTTCVPRS